MSEWISVAEIFGENVFNDAVMQERLPKSGRLKRVPLTIRTGSSLLQEQQLKSMIRLFQHRSQMERS